MKTIIVDDKEWERAELRELLHQYHPAIEIIGEAADVRQGAAAIIRHKPDLVFLDVEMPGGTGFDVVDQLPIDQRPLIIMFTAEQKYGAQAFDVEAIDYLTKPLEKRRLAQAVKRAESRFEERASARQLESVTQELTSTAYEKDTIVIPSEQGRERVRFKDIIYCKGRQGYTEFHLVDGTTRLSAYNIGHFKDQFPIPPFKIIHRSYILHRAYIAADPSAKKVRLKNGDVLPISPKRYAEVRTWANER